VINLAQWEMGPAKWYWDGVLQEFYTKGMEATVTPLTQAVDFDIVGHVDDLETDLEVKVKIAIAKAPGMDLSIVMPYLNKIVDGAKVLYNGAVDIGRSMYDRGKPLLLHPNSKADADVSEDFYLPKAVCVAPFHEVWDNGTVKIIEAEFTGYVNNLTDKIKFQIGDRSASADVTAPTVDSTVPDDNAVGIAKATGLHIDFVMDEKIDPLTAVKGNTVIQKVTDMALFTDYSVSYLSASNTIRITTTGALAGNTEYLVTLTTGVKDLAGNALAAPNQLTFTTGA
jgi:hypothetical protein